MSIIDKYGSNLVNKNTKDSPYQKKSNIYFVEIRNNKKLP